MTPQDITVQTYKDNFDLYKEKTPNEVSGEFVAWMDNFIKVLPPQGKIFELGSAEGRDARYLRDRGFELLCTDVIPQAIESLQADGFKTSMYDFRDEPQKEWINSYDAIFAKAVYLHATQEVFEKSLSRLSAILKDGGIFCLTFKLGEGEEIETGKLGGERYFKYYTEQELKNIFEKYHQYEIVDVATTSDNKWVKKWIQFLLRKN